MLMQKNKLLYSEPECKQLKLEPGNLVCQSPNLAIYAIDDFELLDSSDIVFDL